MYSTYTDPYVPTGTYTNYATVPAPSAPVDDRAKFIQDFVKMYYLQTMFEDLLKQAAAAYDFSTGKVSK